MPPRQPRLCRHFSRDARCRFECAPLECRSALRRAVERCAALFAHTAPYAILMPSDAQIFFIAIRCLLRMPDYYALPRLLFFAAAATRDFDAVYGAIAAECR